MKRGTFDLLAVIGIFAAYAITLRLALHSDLRGSLLGGLANTVPVVIFGALVRRIIFRRLIGKPAANQLAAHVVMCAAFAVLSYGLLIVLLGFLFGGGTPGGFLVQPFSTSGTAWQSLENVTTYALIATVSHLQALHAATIAPRAESNGGADLRLASKSADAALAPAAATETDPALSRYFVRIGDELRPLDMDTVVSIGGADDYAEVRTLTGKHLVRVTLAEFSKSLDPAEYVRAHRSWIVNVRRIARAEPAGGGRLLLHMETGQTISTSRAGAKLLRDRVI
ncbi:LytTR family DNA-binding domain-containing protein [Dyella sp. 2HG41-7]|uniref:LytR/AlgR family response regulator transcription factor n=1 Tax=Dyella sp. 2HG41-7 TaxID=2883239 RepID=UPI001F284EAB|nr:LytTR family DNA-binding domain-containing protein [Dyella sp. 2HG41-7]